jgi:hypothetical protein
MAQPLKIEVFSDSEEVTAIIAALFNTTVSNQAY